MRMRFDLSRNRFHCIHNAFHEIQTVVREFFQIAYKAAQNCKSYTNFIQVSFHEIQFRLSETIGNKQKSRFRICIFICNYSLPPSYYISHRPKERSCVSIP